MQIYQQIHHLNKVINKLKATFIYDQKIFLNNVQQLKKWKKTLMFLKQQKKHLWINNIICQYWNLILIPKFIYLQNGKQKMQAFNVPKKLAYSKDFSEVNYFYLIFKQNLIN